MYNDLRMQKIWNQFEMIWTGTKGMQEFPYLIQILQLVVCVLYSTVGQCRVARRGWNINLINNNKSGEENERTWNCYNDIRNSGHSINFVFVSLIVSIHPFDTVSRVIPSMVMMVGIVVKEELMKWQGPREELRSWLQQKVAWILIGHVPFRFSFTITSPSSLRYN